MYGRASIASAIVVMDLDDADVQCQMPMSLPRLFMDEKKSMQLLQSGVIIISC
jgi:hypothetical protein